MRGAVQIDSGVVEGCGGVVVEQALLPDGPRVGIR